MRGSALFSVGVASCRRVFSWFLPRLVGISKALEWCYKGDVFPAQEALDGGLVNEVVLQEQLLNRAKEIARSLRKKPRSQLRSRVR